MKFIFPENYKYKYKILGFLDTYTIIVNIIWLAFTYCLSNIIFNKLIYKIYFCIIFYLPLFLISVIGFEHENIFYVCSYIYKFKKNCKVYLYK